MKKPNQQKENGRTSPTTNSSSDSTETEMRSLSPTSFLQSISSTNNEEDNQESELNIEQQILSSLINNQEDLNKKVEEYLSSNNEQIAEEDEDEDVSYNETCTSQSTRIFFTTNIEEKPSRLRRMRSASTTITFNNDIKSKISLKPRRKSTNSSNLQTNSEKVIRKKNDNLDKKIKLF